MANIMANKLPGKENIAYFMNSISYDDDTRKLTLFNASNPDIKSETELVLDKDIYYNGKFSKNIYNAADYLKDINMDTAVGCTVELQNLIDDVYKSGGGVIKFDRRKYRFSYINIPSHVFLEGAGIGNTIFERITNTVTGSVKDEELEGYGFINIPESTDVWGIRNLTLYGAPNHSVDQSDGIDYLTHMDTAKTVHGLFIHDCSDVVGHDKEMKKIFHIAPLYTLGLEVDNTNVSGYMNPYKYSLVENVACIGFSGCGIYTGNWNYNMRFNNVFSISNKLYGLYCKSQRGIYNSITCEWNFDGGIFVSGDNNRFISPSIYDNGFRNHSAHAIETSLISFRNVFEGIDCEDNWCNGVMLQGQSNTINGSIGTNGYLAESYEDNSNLFIQDCALLTINEANHCKVDIVFSHHLDGGVTARIPMETFNAFNCIINITENINCARDVSSVNGTTIGRDQVIQTVIDNNIINYLQTLKEEE